MGRVGVASGLRNRLAFMGFPPMISGEAGDHGRFRCTFKYVIAVA